ncbi:MAG: DUF4236 domain-containing protein [Deltaproteobacteria bacterium]|jgi:hypothetical protein|nr:DUF4236 domain-containing protein [Deltaproteobacteria bacterium]
MRFRRSIKLFPGFKVNIGKGGISSFSLFKRGLSLSFGKQGTHLNVGIPGTGLSHRVRLDAPQKPERQSKARTVRTPKADYAAQAAPRARVAPGAPRAPVAPVKPSTPPAPLAPIATKATLPRNDPAAAPAPIPAVFRPDWGLDPFKPPTGGPGDPGSFAYDEALNQHRLIKMPPKRPRDAYLSFFTDPPPFTKVPVVVCALSLVALAACFPLGLGLAWKAFSIAVFLFGLIFARRGMSVRREWSLRESRMEELVGHAISGHFTAMEGIFGLVLARIDWVLETDATYEIFHDGMGMSLDVNLPEIEDFGKGPPDAQGASGGGTGKAPWIAKRQFQLFAHSVILRLVGEAFYHFPTVKRVLASGYTDRVGDIGGDPRPEYVISAEFQRAKWAAANPTLADPVECVGLFKVRRDLGDDCGMGRIEPFSAADLGLGP